MRLQNEFTKADNSLVVNSKQADSSDMDAIHITDCAQ